MYDIFIYGYRLAKLKSSKLVIQANGVDYQTSQSLTIEYGDRERISIPKRTIYKVDREYDKTYHYTTLTEYWGYILLARIPSYKSTETNVL